MEAAGIDTKIYKSHSLSMAFASAFLDAEMPMDKVLKLGDWNSEEVFLKFYHRGKTTGVSKVMSSFSRGQGRTRGNSSRPVK
jgi:hypothetical protein